MKKRVFAIVLTVALSIATVISVFAAPHRVTEADRTVLRSIFDAELYASENPDVVNAYGNDADSLFEHFCASGIYEGRKCSPNLDVFAYASAYSDLKDAFGDDIVSYYTHYAVYGVNESRVNSTYEACRQNGIAVQDLYGNSISIGNTTFGNNSSIEKNSSASGKSGLMMIILGSSYTSEDSEYNSSHSNSYLSGGGSSEKPTEAPSTAPSAAPSSAPAATPTPAATSTPAESSTSAESAPAVSAAVSPEA